jgi:hypothetical protein
MRSAAALLAAVLVAAAWPAVDGGFTAVESIDDVTLMAWIRASIPRSGLSVHDPRNARVTTPSGVEYFDYEHGAAEAVPPAVGDVALVRYKLFAKGEGVTTGTRYIAGVPDSTFMFTVGGDKAPAGFSEVVQSMRPGGKRFAVLPAGTMYGDGENVKGSPNFLVLPNEDLHAFVVRSGRRG